jgi:hypothetical protein
MDKPTFTSEILPLRQLTAKYAAAVVNLVGYKKTACEILEVSRNTLDTLLKEAGHYAQRQSR